MLYHKRVLLVVFSFVELFLNPSIKLFVAKENLIAKTLAIFSLLKNLVFCFCLSKIGESDWLSLRYKPIRNGKQRKKFALYFLFLALYLFKIVLFSPNRNEEIFYVYY